MTFLIKRIPKMKYYVGQVIYVVLRKEAKVYPMQITEEITKKTMSGEQINYVVSSGPNKSSMLINEIDGEIFDSADNVKRTLIDRASVNIEKIVTNAIKKADEWYVSPHQVQQNAHLQTQVASIPNQNNQGDMRFAENKVTVSIDGMKTNVKMPEILNDLQ